MSYGFYCKNSDNITQIDENYSNFAIYSSGVGTIGPAPPSYNKRLFISLTSSHWFWVIDTAEFGNLDTGFGLNIYKPDQTLVFSTNKRYPTIRGCYPFLSTDGGQVNISPPSYGKNLYYDWTGNVISGDWSMYDEYYNQYGGAFVLGISYENNILYAHSDYNYVLQQLAGSQYTGGAFMVIETIYITLAEF